MITNSNYIINIHWHKEQRKHIVNELDNFFMKIAPSKANATNDKELHKDSFNAMGS